MKIKIENTKGIKMTTFLLQAFHSMNSIASSSLIPFKSVYFTVFICLEIIEYTDDL